MNEPSSTRRELEAAVRRLVGSTANATDSATSKLKSAGPFVGVFAALSAFAWGRRRGRQRSAYVEVKRR